jgi:hypothetical protein
MAAWFDARNVFSLSSTGFVGPNATLAVVVFPRSVVSCVDGGLAIGLSPV